MITLLLYSLLSSPLHPGTTDGIDGRVVKVLDGDTIRVALKSGKIETVRFLGIDAPESYIMRYGYSEFLGREASREAPRPAPGKIGSA